MVSERVGEVIAARTTEFRAQSRQLHDAPPFGSLVRVGASEGAYQVYGLVYLVESTTIDPGARPIARGSDEIVDEEVYRAHPDLPHVLRTEFAALIVGFGRGGRVLQHLPPAPPPLHYSVYLCDDEELVTFTQGLAHLRTLLQTPNIASDELVAAHLRQAAAVRPDGADFLLRAGRELAAVLRDDYHRLAAIVRRVQWESPS